MAEKDIKTVKDKFDIPGGDDLFAITAFGTVTEVD